MLGNMPSLMRPAAQQPHQPAGGGYGTLDSHGLTHSVETLSINPGAVDFDEDDLHRSSLTLRQQAKAAVRYMSRLKALLLLDGIALVVVLYLYDPLADGAASTAPGAQVTAFVLALVAVLPSVAWNVEMMEDLVVRMDSETMGVVVNVVFEHLPVLLFSLSSLIWRHHRSLCWIKPILLGCVMFHLLVVLGGSVLVAPEMEDRLGASFGVSTWTTFSTGLVFSCAVFMIPTVYAQTIALPDLNSVMAKKKISLQEAMNEQSGKLLFLSRGLSIAVLLVYLTYLVLVFHAKANYYTSAGNPNSPSTLSYALQYRESIRRSQQGRGHLPVGPRFTVAVAVTAAAVLCGLQAVLCYILVHCLATAVSHTALSLPFTLVVLLPLAFEGGALGAALLISREGRLDIGASISFSAIVHLFLCVLPAIVLVAWACGAPLELSFHPFLACTCFIAVLVVAQMVLVNRARWLEGAMLVGLYVLVGIVCLLGGWHLCFGTEKRKA